MNATLSLVPTPSALATSTGSSKPAASSAEEPAERSDLRQDAGREGAARERLDPAHDFVAGVDVDAGCLVVHAESMPIGCCDLHAQNSSLRSAARHAARAASRPAPASRRARTRRRSAPLRSPPRACRTPRAASSIAGSRSFRVSSTLSIERRVAQRDGAERQRDRRARGIARRSACVDQRVDGASSRPATRQRAEARRPTRAAAPGIPGSSIAKSASRRCTARATRS